MRQHRGTFFSVKKYVCIIMGDFHCCMAETNTTLQTFSKNKKK